MGAGYIFAPNSFGGDHNVFDYSIRSWSIGPDHTDDIEREYRRHLPLHPMVFQFYIDPSGGVHDAGRGFHNLTGKSVEAIIEYLRREDNRLHDGRDDVKVNRLSSMQKETYYKYKDIKKNPPKFITENKNAENIIDNIIEEPSGQTFFAKNGPLNELRSIISNFELKISHDLSWVKGQKGKGILLDEGKMITWPVNRKRKPNHLTMYEYLTGEKLPRENGFAFINGFPFDIDEEGSISTLKETPDDALNDIIKIDYRLFPKESKTAADFWVPGGDVNMGYKSPNQGDPEYDYTADKLRLNPQKEIMDDIDVGIENLNENELKQAVSNAIRIALLSPKQPLHGNAMVYQALLDVP